MNTKNIEVSVVMPCLDEEDTLGVCIQKVQDTLPPFLASKIVRIEEAAPIFHPFTLPIFVQNKSVGRRVRGFFCCKECFNEIRAREIP